MDTSTGFSVNQKGSVLPVILIALLAGGGIFLGFNIVNTNTLKLQTVPKPSSSVDSKPMPIIQMSQKPTVKTYQDYKLDFKFEYPYSGFEVIEDSEEKYFQISKTDHRKNFTGYVGYEPPKLIEGLMLRDVNTQTVSQYDSMPLVLWVFDNPGKLDIDAWFDKYWYYPFVWGIFAQPGKGHIYPSKEATISGKLAKSVVVSYQPGKPEFIYIANEDKMFMFRTMRETDEKTITQVLSSFRFTK